MKKLTRKEVATYLPLAPILALVWWLGRERLDGFLVLLRLMILIFGYVAAVTDAREQRVPNSLVLWMIGAWALVMAPQLFLRPEDVWYILINSLLGMALAGVVLVTVYLISRHGLGGGDVKFMTAAGLYLGLWGIMPSLVMGSLLAAVTGVIAIARKKMDRKGTIPLIPFLYVGIVLTLLFR